MKMSHYGHTLSHYGHTLSHYGHTLEIYMPKFRAYNNVLVSATLVECVEYVHNSPPLTRHVQLPTIFHSCRLNRHLIVEDNYFHPPSLDRKD